MFCVVGGCACLYVVCFVCLCMRTYVRACICPSMCAHTYVHICLCTRVWGNVYACMCMGYCPCNRNSPVTFWRLVSYLNCWVTCKDASLETTNQFAALVWKGEHSCWGSASVHTRVGRYVPFTLQCTLICWMGNCTCLCSVMVTVEYEVWTEAHCMFRCCVDRSPLSTAVLLLPTYVFS
jgi:hypothetical protein